MRNLKRALSLGLTAAMISGLMVMGSSAASYADVTSENNQEAIDVLQTVGIMVGDENGNFNPDQNVTRNEMAVVMANLMEYNVASYKDTSPFTDVPSWAEPYVAACWTNGITAGYSDTIYGGSDTVTTAQAALMLMKALGYFQYASDFGSDWQLATTRQGNAIDLFNGVDSGVTQAMTRNDVAQLVLNTLQAGTVQASTDGSWTIGDVTINNNVTYNYITSNQTYATAIDDARSTSSTTDAGRSIVELGEQLYQGDLKLNDNTIDDFGRPSRTWSYDGKEIGTYAKRELQIATYTTGVTGKEMYDLLSSATIRDSEELFNYVDGEEGKIVKNDLVRSNDDDLYGTGTGVLTEVYLDNDAKEITIASINTYLAKANSDYNENTESASLTVYISNADGETRTVDVEEVPAAADVVEDGFYLVNMTKMDNSRLEVVALTEAEVLENSTVTKFSTDDTLVVDKLTVDGTQYEAAAKAYFDKDTLEEYDQSLLTDMSYNVYLDPYGNAIGVELYEGTLNYVFITGYDRTGSNISIKTADAAAIFLDGTMDTITVNVTDTNKNIDKLDGKDENDAGNLTGDDRYYEQWTSGGDYSLNRWYTYTVTENGVYTLKPVGDGERMIVTNLADGTVINCSNVRLDDMYGWNGRAYGNDNSVYITAEAGEVDNSHNADAAITEVEGLYTGVQNVDIEMTAAARGDVTDTTKNTTAQAANVYTVFDSDRYIIGSIVLGEAQGSTANYAYILSGAKSEEKIGDTYYWEFDAVLGGEKQTLTAASKYPSTITELEVGKVQELRFDGDYVISVKDIPAADIYNTSDYRNGIKIDDEEVYFVDVDNRARGEALRLEGRTLYTDTFDVGLTLTSDAKAVVIQDENNKKDVKTNYATVAEAVAALGDPSTATGKQYVGRIIAVLNSQGVAEWVVFDSDTAIRTGSDNGYVDDSSNILNAEANRYTMTVTVDALKYATEGELRNAVVSALQEIGYNASYVNITGAAGNATWTGEAWSMTDGNMAFFNVIVNRKVTISIDGEVVQTLPMGGISTEIDMSDYKSEGGTGYLLQTAPNGAYAYKNYDNTDIDVKPRDDSMDIRTGYVQINGGETKETYALAGNVTLTFTAAGSYKITIDGKDTFVTVDKNGSVNVNADKDITVADYTFPEKAVEDAAEAAGVVDKSFATGNGSMEVDMEKGIITLNLNNTVDAWTDLTGADTNLFEMAKALLDDSYTIRVACGGDAKTISGTMNTSDILTAVQDVIGSVPGAGESKTVTVTVSDGNNPVDYTVTIHVAEA